MTDEQLENKQAELEEQLEAIAGGYHGDAFAILGSHAVENRGRTEWEIRAFYPQAKQVEVVAAGQAVVMDRVHPTGIFAARFASAPDAYKFRITDHHGRSTEQEDVYSFPTLLSEFDLHLFLEGTNYEAYNALGAHTATVNGVPGTRFAVWAPNAIVVSVVGDFNDWDTRRNPMRARTGGVWELFIPGVHVGGHYKYS